MRIAEIYESIQGEGFLTGTPSVFVRASGCNLRCGYCDTPYASWQPEGDDLSVDEIVGKVLAQNTKHVVVTGGEPMLFAELIPLCRELVAHGRHVTIETAGTLLLPVVCQLMSISPKMSNSDPGSKADARWHRRHQRNRFAPDVVRSLVTEYTCQVKFVVDRPDDLDEVEHYLAGFPEISRDRVLIMPQGTEPVSLALTGAWLQPYCLQHGFHYCPRMQVEWFGGVTRGT